MAIKNLKIKNIIWDLSGTLFRPSTKRLTANKIQDFSLLLYLWSGKKTTNKYDRIALEILTNTKKQSKKRQVILLHTGKPVPEIICLWLSGIITNLQAYQRTMLSYKNFMSKTTLNNSEKILIKNMIYTLFDPRALAYVMQPVVSLTSLLQECAMQNQYKFFILSNWDLESFSILYKSKKGQKIFRYFDLKNIIISDQTGYMKPQKEIYQYFLKKTKIKPTDSLFIDDQVENLAAAKQFGIIPIQFKNNNAQKVRTELIKYNIL